jgi:hypothetical protein
MSLRKVFSNQKIAAGLKTKLLSEQAESDLPSPTEQKSSTPTAHATSPLQIEVNNKFLADLTKHVELLETALPAMQRLRKSTNSQIDISYFAHIKSSKSDVLNHSIMRAQIKNELEHKPTFLQAYRDFNQALNELKQVQEYFSKSPFCVDKAFLNLYQFHKKEYESKKGEISKIREQCDPYHNFAANVVKVCDGTVPAPAQLIS